MDSFEVKDTFFYSKGLKCAAWLYLPSSVKKPPLVVMAHGIAAERSFRLPAFAERFAQNGMAVFLFDYRNFGDSQGEPRNLVDPFRHIQDWFAALDHVRKLGNVNGKRIALWGTSFSGGHVLEVAGKDQKISAIVTQVPFVDGLSTSFNFPLSYLGKGVINGALDLGKSLLSNEPHTIKVVDSPHSFALLNTEECYEGYLNLVPEESSWENKCPARIMWKMPLYRPVRNAPKIKCPVLLIYAEEDTLIPVSDVRKAARRIKDVREVPFPGGHFDLYYGDKFEKNIQLQTEFLINELLD